MAKPAKIVAEIGCNHKGDMAIAKEMIQIAATYCKADYVKFQKRNNRELLTPKQYNAPHPNPANAYGETYGAHREFLEFSVDQNRELMEYCAEQGIGYSTSVWDVTSAKQMSALQPEFLKVPSATNLHWGVLEVLCGEFGGHIQLSLGMTTHDEEDQIVRFFEDRGRNKDLLLYACTSGYPVSFDDLCLLEVKRLKDKFDGQVSGIGFSGHHLGIAADIAALTLGAEWIERHFTMDRTWKGTDHAASLEPDGLRRLCRDVKAVSASLTYKGEQMMPVEQATRDKLKWTDQSQAAA